jgi:hypothetical protein
LVRLRKRDIAGEAIYKSFGLVPLAVILKMPLKQADSEPVHTLHTGFFGDFADISARIRPKKAKARA